MNYRTLAKGALALSLSLIVGSAMAATTTADVQKYGATFESVKNTTAGELNDYAYEVGTNITKYATAGSNGESSGWFGAAEDESKIIARTDAAGGQALQLNTEAGVLTNKLQKSIADDINTNGIAKAGAFIETEAKFVASDTPDAGVVGGTDDTKFAIYAYADESKSPCTTNLVVYHAYVNGQGNIDYTNEVFDTLVDCDAYTKLRVEMKQMDTGSDGLMNVFSVSVNNGTPLTSDLAFDAYFEEKPTGKWFLTVEKFEVDANKQLASVTFKGTGEVDNLSVGIIKETTTYAVDWTGSANVVVSNATEALTGTTATVDPATVITFYPTEGNVITNVFVGGVAQTFDPASYAITVNSDTNVVVLAGTQAAPPATVFSVASVGNATVTGDNGVYTITVPEGSSLSSVFVNGAAITPTENQDGTYSIDVSALTGNVNVVVATTKVRPAVAHKWYENPGMVYSYKHVYAGDDNTVSGFNWAIENGNDYFLDLVGQCANGAMLLDFNALEANAGTDNALPMIWKYPSTNNRGGTVSKEHNVALIGTYSGPVVYAVPLSADAADTTGEVTNKTAITFKDTSGTQLSGVSMLRFSANGNYIYAQADGQDYIYKFPAAADFTQDVEIQAVAQYNIGTEVRNFAYGVVNNTEVIFAGNNSKTVKLLNLSTGAVSDTTAIEAIKYDQLNVAGTNLYVGHPYSTSGTLDSSAPLLTQYAIGSDFSLTQTREWTVKDFLDITGATFASDKTRRMAFTVSDDEKSLVIAFQTTDEQDRFLIQYVEPPAPTVISIALVNGATYTDANGTLNFEATEGYTVTSIYTNGVDTGSTTTFTTNGLTGTINIVAAATKTRTAPAHKWWENPGVVGTTTVAKGGDIGAYNGTIAGDFVGFGRGMAQYGAWLFDLDSLIAGNASPIFYQGGMDFTGLAVPQSDGSLAGGADRGAVVSTKLNVELVFSYTRNLPAVAYPLNTNTLVKGENSFVIDNDKGWGMGSGFFSSDCQYLYTDSYATDGSNARIIKWRVLNGLKTSGTNLVYEGEFPIGNRVRSMCGATINGKDLIFCLCNDKTARVLDTTETDPTQAVKTLGNLSFSGSYSSMYVSGANTTTPHLVVGEGANNAAVGGVNWAVEVFALTSTGLGVTADTQPIYTIDGTVMDALGLSKNSYGVAIVATEDEGTLLLGINDKIYAIKYVEPAVPTYAVNWTGSQNVDVTVDGDAWDGGTSGNFTNNTVVTFTPTEGNVITNVNGEAVSLRGLDLTVTEATNIVVLAGVQSQPQGYNYPDDTAITNADQLAWITAKGFSQGDIKALRTNAKFNECYLLNCNIAAPGAGGSIAITGITVDAQGVHVTVALTRSGAYANEGINGTLKLQGTADLATAPATLTTDVSVDNAKFTTDGPATATFTGTGATFFKAIVE